jgi:hypothetical protein
MSNTFGSGPGAYYESDPVDDIDGLGIAGFVVSVVGIVATCGLLCPVGLVLSLVALIKPPRGFAIAGTVLGALGSFWLALWGLAMVAAVLGISSAATTLRDWAETGTALNRARQSIEQYGGEHGELPDGIEGNKLIVDIRDGWNNDIRYEPDDHGYTIRSGGPDGEFDTGDDVTINRQGSVANFPQSD